MECDVVSIQLLSSTAIDSARTRALRTDVLEADARDVAVVELGQPAELGECPPDLLWGGNGVQGQASGSFALTGASKRVLGGLKLTQWLVSP